MLGRPWSLIDHGFERFKSNGWTLAVDFILFMDEIQVSNLTHFISTCHRVDLDDFEPMLSRDRRLLKQVYLDFEVPNPRSFVHLMGNGIANLVHLTNLRSAWDMRSSLNGGNSMALVLSYLPLTPGPRYHRH